MSTEERPQRGPNGLRAVERATALLRVLADQPAGLSLAELARVTELPLTTVHRLVGVLRDAGLLRETPDGKQAIGVMTVVLASSFLAGLDLRDEARPVMQRLVDSTGETCHLGVLASDLIVYLEKVDSPHPVRMFSRVGGVNAAATTAIGRAILAYSPPDAVETALATSSQRLGHELDRERFTRLLAEVRERGYSTDIEDNEPSICCVGAPVFDHVGRVTAGISVSTPANRFRRDAVPELAKLVRQGAEEISAALGWDPARPLSVWSDET